jgi:hypothetical protein
MPMNHWIATTAPLAGCSSVSVIASATSGHSVMPTHIGGAISVSTASTIGTRM